MRESQAVVILWLLLAGVAGGAGGSEFSRRTERSKMVN